MALALITTHSCRYCQSYTESIIIKQIWSTLLKTKKDIYYNMLEYLQDGYLASRFDESSKRLRLKTWTRNHEPADTL